MSRFEGAAPHISVVRSGDYRIREIQFCHIQIRFFAKDIRFDAGRFLTCFGVLGFCCFLLLQQGLTDYAIGVRAYPGRFSDKVDGQKVRASGDPEIRAVLFRWMDATVKLYKNMVEWEQKKSLRYEAGNIYLGDSLIAEYRFLKNYYFMAGDRVENSRDSRY